MKENYQGYIESENFGLFQTFRYKKFAYKSIFWILLNSENETRILKNESETGAHLVTWLMVESERKVELLLQDNSI